MAIVHAQIIHTGKLWEGGLKTENSPVAKNRNARLWSAKDVTSGGLTRTELGIEIFASSRFPGISAFVLWEVRTLLEFARDSVKHDLQNLPHSSPVSDFLD